MAKYKYTELAKKIRYCELCGRKLSKSEMILCVQHLKEAVAILKANGGLR